MDQESQETTQEGKTQETGNAACTYRAIETHLNLFDDTVAYRFVAQIASTTSTTYTPIHQKEA